MAGKFMSLDLDTLISLVLQSLKVTVQSDPKPKPGRGPCQAYSRVQYEMHPVCQVMNRKWWSRRRTKLLVIVEHPANLIDEQKKKKLRSRFRVAMSSCFWSRI